MLLDKVDMNTYLRLQDVREFGDGIGRALELVEIHLPLKTERTLEGHSHY
jgi:hypothetical protein